MGNEFFATIKRLASLKVWSGETPSIPDSLMYAVASFSLYHEIDKVSEEEFNNYLKKNPGVARLFNEYNANTIGFTFRAHKMSR